MSGSYDDWSKQELVQRAREIGIKGLVKIWGSADSRAARH